MSAAVVRKTLEDLADPKAAKAAAGFFKTGPGEYGEGDVFIGVRVPQLRRMAREHRQLPLADIESLLHSPIHEERGLALLVLVHQFATDPRTIYDFYRANIERVNNWDLVDVSAPPIVGGYLAPRSRAPLRTLVKSKSVWQRRIAIVATQHLIRLGDFTETLDLSRRLLGDEHDLIHKAAGWMLREVGNRDEATLLAFLDQHAARMPRTMLRYAIERLSPVKRAAYMTGSLSPRYSGGRGSG